MQSPAEDAGSAAGSAPYSVNNVSHVESGAERLSASCAMNTELRVPAEQSGKWQEWAEKGASKAQESWLPWVEQACLSMGDLISQGQKGISQQKNNVGV